MMVSYHISQIVLSALYVCTEPKSTPSVYISKVD